MRYPFITLPDPAVSGEGSLDPLGLSPIADRLADSILPGLRARMSRPRFLTAMAVSAAVCEGLDDKTAADGTTSPEIVFEWLLVEGFARCASEDETRRTPGIEKARICKRSGERMAANRYLRVPTVFGFHGVYKALAMDLRIVDDDLGLGDNGYALLAVWEEEQKVFGFIERAHGRNGNVYKSAIRSALKDGLDHGYTERSGCLAWLVILCGASNSRSRRHSRGGFALETVAGRGRQHARRSISIA